MTTDNLKRTGRIVPENTTRCIGCGVAKPVLVSSQFAKGWGICRPCSELAVGIFDANSEQVTEFFKHKEGGRCN